MAIKLNPFTGEFDLVGGSTTSTVFIPQLDSDPSSPNEESAWVLKSGGGGGGAGSPIGLLLSLTYASSMSPLSYEFSYRTKESTTVRVTLS